MNRLLALLLVVACRTTTPAPPATPSTPAPAPVVDDMPTAAGPVAADQAEAIFAAGCFWCAEKDFEKLPGVISVHSGYAGGQKPSPTYKEVGGGSTGHTEAIRVVYDPAALDYSALLHHFWRHVDPFDAGGQFCDRGSQYRPAILPVTPEQRAAAEASKGETATLLGQAIAVTIEDPGPFWLAETYHQDFYLKSPERYNAYRTGCGRDARTRAVWAGHE